MSVDTTTASVTRTVPTPWARRIINIVKLQFANPWTSVYIPVMIWTFIFGVNYAIWYLADRYGDGAGPAPEIDPTTGQVLAETEINSGGQGFLLIYMLVVAVQTMNLTFSFAMGFGVTRRDYYVGTLAFFGTLTLGYSAATAVLAQAEVATNGWGFRARFFSLDYLGVDPGLQTFVFYVISFLFFMLVGAAVATVYVRWKANGLLTFFGGLVVLLIAAAWWATTAEAWPSIGRAIESAGTMGVAYWSLIVSALAGLGGFLLLRRATPRS